MDAYKMRVKVDDYLIRHNMLIKKSYFNPFAKKYRVITQGGDVIDCKITLCKNGSEKISFKVDGKIRSINK